MPRMKYGYARVSPDDQKTDLQIAVLKKAGYRKSLRHEMTSHTKLKNY